MAAKSTPKTKRKKRGRPRTQPLTKDRQEIALRLRGNAHTVQSITQYLGISTSTWYRWMANKPEFKRALARAYGDKVDSLYSKAFEIAFEDGHPDQVRMLMFLLERVGHLHRIDIVARQEGKWDHLAQGHDDEAAEEFDKLPTKIEVVWPADMEKPKLPPGTEDVIEGEVLSIE